MPNERVVDRKVTGPRIRNVWLRITVVLALVVIGTSMILWMTRGVYDQVEALGTDNSDNVGWNLSYLRIELQALEIAIRDADLDPSEEALRDVRQRFDVFYSRVNIFRTSSYYNQLTSDERSQKDIATIRAYLDKWVPVIDGPDPALRAALPTLEAETEALDPIIRAFTVSSLARHQELNLAERGKLRDTLIFIGLATVGLVAALSAVLLLLVRTNREVHANSRALESTSKRLEAIIQTSLDGILVIDDHATITGYNGAAELIFGYSREEAIGRDMVELIVPPHFRAAHKRGMDRYRETGEKRVADKGRFQLEAMRKDGTVFPVELSISSEHTGREDVFISYVRDISQQVASEQELLRARDDAVAGEKAKADLLAVMSHEMRTPLNGMLGTMELLSDTGLNAKQENYLRIMETSGQLLLHHVNDVLEISRLDSGKAKLELMEFRLSEVVQHVIESQDALARSNGNALSCARVGPEIGYVRGDMTKIKQVLLNLVGNAVKFTQDGKVSLEIERLTESGVVEFRVRDTGAGISEVDKSRIFRDFVTLDSSYSRRSGGTGLGLGISKRMVHAMGGEIGLESELGKGSLFWVRIPLQIVTTPSDDGFEQLSQKDEVVSVRPLNVLLVEDNEINRIIAREMLEGQGHRVEEAPNGEIGVSKAIETQYDLILMDISMPEMDGVTAVEILRNHYPDKAIMPIVALTAHALPDELKRFAALGFNTTLVKPISKARLGATIAEIVGAESGSVLEEEAEVDEDVDLIDAETLLELVENMGPQRVQSLVAQVRTEYGGLIAAHPAGDAKQAAEALSAAEVHKLAGSAAVIGAQELRMRMARLEAALKAGDEEASGELWAGIPELADASFAEFETILEDDDAEGD